MPSLFVSHGAPTLVFDDCPARTFLRDLGRSLPRPRAILAISAHWETPEPRVLTTLQPATVHDFNGFEPALYEQRYPAPGALALAETLATLVRNAGFGVTADSKRGLDHGVWVPLSLLYPQADIPLTQLSVCPRQSARYHWELGCALAPLRDDGVLIVGSGSITHNLGDVRFRHRPGPDVDLPTYVTAFPDWVATQVGEGNLDALLDWAARAPHAVRAHPSPEHWLPFYVALGAAGIAWSGVRAHHSITYGVIGMDNYLFQSTTTNH